MEEIEKTGRRAGRPATDPFWVGRIRALKANEARDASPAAIARMLAEEGKRSGRDDYPTTGKTVKKIVDRTPPDELNSYRYFRWPQSMGTADLPWAASEALLALVRHFWQADRVRPTIRLATWYWRVYQSAPAAQAKELVDVAFDLAAHEILGEIPDYVYRRCELALALRIWDGQGLNEWKAAMEDEGLEFPSDSLTVANTLDRDTRVDLLLTSGISLERALQTTQQDGTMRVDFRGAENKQ